MELQTIDPVPQAPLWRMQDVGKDHPEPKPKKEEEEVRPARSLEGGCVRAASPQSSH
jgi:hypothetical protein